jgi:hypothetical protein
MSVQPVPPAWPSPMKPVLHMQLYDPGVFLHAASLLQSFSEACSEDEDEDEDEDEFDEDEPEIVAHSLMSRHGRTPLIITNPGLQAQV